MILLLRRCFAFGLLALSSLGVPLAHAQNQLLAAQVEAKIRQAGGLYRVYIGPYPARNDAERVGERITQAFGFATSVAPH